MTDAKTKRKQLLSWRKAVICLLVLAMLVTFAACGEEVIDDLRAYAGEGDAEQNLRDQLASETVKEITIQGTLYMCGPVEIPSDKTINGDGKIKAIGDWSEYENDYVLIVQDGAEVTLAGSLTVDANNCSGGVYVSEGAQLNLTEEAVVRRADEDDANVMVEGNFSMEGGYLQKAGGHNLYVASTATITGGEINGSGKGYAGVYTAGKLEQSGGTITGAYDNVYVADKASFTWNSGTNASSVNDGVVICAEADLHVTAFEAKMTNPGREGIYVMGSATIDDMLITGGAENQIKIDEGAKVVINEATLGKGETNGIYNRGELLINGCNISSASSTGIVNTGKLEMTGGSIASCSNKGIMVKNGGELTIASSSVRITNNRIGVSVEENAYADISKAAVNSNTTYNFACFGELYLHDLETGASGSNCILTNYSGHVILEDMTITGTTKNNGIYNTNHSLVELKNVTFMSTKTYAIRSLDADVVGENVTVINCGGAISTGDYTFGEAGTVTINNLTTSGVTGSNISTDAYCGGTITLTNSILGATGSNNVSAKGGHVILNNVQIQGNDPAATTTVHGIMLDDGAKITATNVSITDSKVAALRVRGGIFNGTNITVKNAGEYFIQNSNHSTSGVGGNVTINNLVTSNIGKQNITTSGDGVITINGGTICGIGAENNIRIYGGVVTLKDVDLTGHVVDKADDSIHAIMITGGKVVVEGGTIHDTFSCGIRNKGGEVVVKDAKICNTGTSAISTTLNGDSKGVVTVDGLTTENIGGENILTDAGTVTITNSTLGASYTNSVSIKGGTVVLTNTEVKGTEIRKDANVHGVYLTAGDLTIEKVTIGTSDTAALRISGSCNVKGSDITITGSARAIHISGKTTGELKNVTASNITGENILSEGGDLTVTNATLGVNTGNSVSVKGGDVTMIDSKILGTAATDAYHGMYITSGSFTADGLEVQDVMCGLRIKGDDAVVNVDNTYLHDCRTYGMQLTTGTVNMGTVEFEAAANNAFTVNGGKVSVDTLYIHDTGSATDTHAIYVTAGTVTVNKELIVDKTTGAVLRINGGTVTVNNATATNIGTNVVQISKGTLTVNGITTESVGSNNINVAGGTLTVNGYADKNSVLGISGMDSISLAADVTLTVNDTNVLGAAEGYNAVTTTAGTLNLNDVATTGTVVNGATVAVTGGSVTGTVKNAYTMAVEGAAVTGAVENSSTLTLTDLTVTGKISNTGSLTLANTYVSESIYTEVPFTYKGTDVKHSASDPLLIEIPAENVKAGTVLVAFDDAETAAALKTCFTVPESYFDGYFDSNDYTFADLLTVKDNTLQFFKDPNAYVAAVNGVKYRILADAVAAAAEESIASGAAVTVTLIEDCSVESIIAIPAGANIIITDDGSARTIQRSGTSWSTTARGPLFDVSGTLNLQSTTNSNDNCNLVLDGNNAILAPTNGNWVLVQAFSGSTINVAPGVKFTNNTTTGAGSAIRLDGGSNANITGGVFTNLVVGGSNGAGAINVATTNKVTISKAVFSYNTTVKNSGAIRVNTGANVEIDNCKFIGNKSTGEYGGAVYASGTADVTTYLKITNCYFESNTASGAGGAINAGNYAEVTIENTEFKKNSSTGNSSGAVHCSGKTKLLTITGCTFTENTAAANGGAIQMVKGSITNCTFTDNSTSASGGAINSAASKVENCVITNCTITGNTAKTGGGVYAPGDKYLTLDGCTVTGNTATNTAEGQNVQIAGSDGRVHLVVKATDNGAVLDLYMRNKSTVKIEGTLAQGSEVVCYWYTANFEAAAPGYGAIVFDSEEAAKVNSRCIQLSDNMITSWHLVYGYEEGAGCDANYAELQSGAGVINVAYVNGTLYTDFTEAVKAAIDYSVANNTQVTVELLEDVELSPTIYDDVAAAIQIRSGADIIITDDGVERTLLRSASWGQTTRGVLFDVLSGGKLTLTSTGDDSNSKLIIDGNRSLVTPTDANWALIQITSGEVTIEKGVVLQNNYSTRHGGAIRVEGTGAKLTVTGGKFLNNEAAGSGVSGGALYIVAGTAEISNAYFEGNIADSNCGGAIHNAAATTIRNCTFASNKAKYGGAINGANNYTTIMVDCLFEKNSATQGGAVNGAAKATMNAQGCEFTGNSTTGNGGAIHLAIGTVKNCTFTGNKASSENAESGYCGGAINSNSSKVDGIVVESCTFEKNSADKGGVVNLAGGKYITLKDCVFSDNTSNSEGKDIRLGNAASRVYLSGKIVAYVHNQNASTVYVNGTLSEGSEVTCDWLVTDSARIPAVAVQFESAEDAANSIGYFSMGTICTSNSYSLSLSGATAVLVKA